MRRLLLLLFFVWLTALPLSAQDEIELTVLGVDSADFPDIDITFNARDTAGSGLEILPDLRLFENDAPVMVSDMQIVPTGVDVTFVIDTNSTIAGIDLIGDISRLDKVKEVIGTFTERYAGLGLDRVTVIAGQDDAAFFVVENASDAGTVREALASYNPESFPREAPVQTMLDVAFQQAAEREPTSKYQAIVLFSDALMLAEQVNFFEIREIAQQSDAVFFAAILGKFASDAEVANVGELYIPTGGTWVHMPQPEDFVPISEIIDSNRQVRRLRYRSEVREGGAQQVQLIIGETSVTTSYEVEILPPEILFLMEETPIVRSPDAENPTEFVPTRQQIRAQIMFPDDHPRGLDNVRFFVNGLEQRFGTPPVYDESGLLTFDWGIRAAETGSYNLEIEITDELNHTVRSQPFTQQLILRTGEEPTPEPTTPSPAPTLVPPPLQPAIDQVQQAIESGLVINILSGIAALLLAILLWRLWRRRGRKKSEPVTVIVAQPAIQLPKNVFLEWEREGKEKQLFPINSPSVIVGSDPFRAEIILGDDSVSRRHARIAYEDNNFVLYDEASAYGTRINFNPVHLRPRIINSGDELQFGSVRTIFRIYTSSEDFAPSDTNTAAAANVADSSTN